MQFISRISHKYIICYIFILSLFLTATNISLSQKKTTSEETQQETKISSDCKYVKNFISSLDKLRNLFSDVNYKTKPKIAKIMVDCKSNLQKVKDNCPDTDISKYTEEFDNFEQQWALIQTKEGKLQDASVLLHNSDILVEPIMELESIPKGSLSNKDSAIDFFNSIRIVDYVHVKPAVEKFIIEHPDFKEKNKDFAEDYQHVIVDFPRHFDSLININLLNEITFAINKSKVRLAEKYVDAIEIADAARFADSSIFFVYPNHPQALKLKQEADDNYKEISSKMSSAIFTSDLHKTNTGKILFSKSQFVIKKENPIKITDQFAADENIFGMIYLSDVLKNLIPPHNICSVVILSDGKELVKHSFQIPSDKRGLSYFPLEILVEPAKSSTSGINKFVKALSNLEPAKHQIKVIFQSDKNTLGEGEFTFDCSNLYKLKVLSLKVKEQELSYVPMPQAKKSDPQLEKEMMNLLSDWKEKPLRIVITDDEWQLERNVVGVIVLKFINTAVAVKTDDGKCKYIKVSFKQVYQTESYGITEIYKIGESRNISCDNVFK